MMFFKMKVLNFDDVQFSYFFSFVALFLMSYLRNHCLVMDSLKQGRDMAKFKFHLSFEMLFLLLSIKMGRLVR